MYWIPLISVLMLQPQQDKIKTLEIGSDAPMREHKMENVDGKKQSIEDLKGENGTLVIFSCNTCPFVVGNSDFKGWEGSYASVAKNAKAHGIGLAMINSNEAKREGDDSMSEMQQRAKKKKYKWSYLVDTDSKMADAFGARTTPHVFLFDKDWKLVYEGSIDDMHEAKDGELKPYLDNAMSNMTAGKDIDPAKTRAIGCSIKRNK